jgi:hypothetical protein
VAVRSFDQSGIDYAAVYTNIIVKYAGRNRFVIESSEEPDTSSGPRSRHVTMRSMNADNSLDEFERIYPDQTIEDMINFITGKIKESALLNYKQRTEFWQISVALDNAGIQYVIEPLFIRVLYKGLEIGRIKTAVTDVRMFHIDIGPNCYQSVEHPNDVPRVILEQIRLLSKSKKRRLRRKIRDTFK